MSNFSFPWGNGGGGGGNGPASGGGGAMQGLGMSPAQPVSAPAIPTEGQITSTQAMPRADTALAGASSGMALPSEVLPQQAQGIQAPQISLPAQATASQAIQPTGNAMLSSVPRTAPPTATISNDATGMVAGNNAGAVVNPTSSPAMAAEQQGPAAAPAVNEDPEIEAIRRESLPKLKERFTKEELEILRPWRRDKLIEAAIGKRQQQSAQGQETPAAKTPEQNAADPFGEAFTEFSGKPDEAIEHLLKVKRGHVPAAFNKEGLGDIDLPWGKGGKNGFGLAHIIERRGEDGEKFARSLPTLIKEGAVEKRSEYPGRAYIINKKSEAVVRLEWDGNKKTWLVSAYPINTKESSLSPDRTTDLDQTYVPEKTKLPRETQADAEKNDTAPTENVNSQNSHEALAAGRKDAEKLGLTTENSSLPPGQDVVKSQQQEKGDAGRQERQGQRGISEPTGHAGQGSGGSAEDIGVPGLREQRGRGEGGEEKGSGSAVRGTGTRGISTRVAVPNREKINTNFEIVEAGDVQPSHLPNNGFQKNPKYTLENERRYHDEPDSRDKVIKNASDLDPDLLMDSPDANQGAPVVDHEGNVLGGNGRAMSIQRAYEKSPLSSERYIEALRENAQRFGIDPSVIDDMKRPVLIRRTADNLPRQERQSLVSALNESFAYKRDKRADAKSRGDRFSKGTIRALASGFGNSDSLRAYFDEPASSGVVDMMVKDGVIQIEERAAYVGADGLLNPDGKTLVEQALRSRVARNYESLAKLSADVLGKLDAVIPHILVSENIGKPWSITDDVRDAVDLMSAYQGTKKMDIRQFLDEMNMLTGKTQREGKSDLAVSIFKNAIENKKKDFTSLFTSYASHAKKSPEANGLGLGKSQPELLQELFGVNPSQEKPKAELKPEKKPEQKTEPKAKEPAEEKGIAQKIGEHIGGSRADTAQSTGKRQTFGSQGWRKSIRIDAGEEDELIATDIKTKKVIAKYSGNESMGKMLPADAANFYHKIKRRIGPWGYAANNSPYTITRQRGTNDYDIVGKEFSTQREASDYLEKHAGEILDFEFYPEDAPTWRKHVAVLPSEKGFQIFNLDNGKQLTNKVFGSAEEAEKILPLAAVSVKHYVGSGRNGEFEIRKTISNGNRITVKDGFATREDALKYMGENAEELMGEKHAATEKGIPRTGGGDPRPQRIVAIGHKYSPHGRG